MSNGMVSSFFFFSLWLLLLHAPQLKVSLSWSFPYTLNKYLSTNERVNFFSPYDGKWSKDVALD